MQNEVVSVLEEFKSLQYDVERGILSGSLYASQEDEDAYQVEMLIGRYPKRFPTVWETNERIPRKADRHCNDDDGSLCFTTRPKEEILLRTRIRSLKAFISDILIPFLQNNSHYELHGKYCFKVHSHNWDTAIDETFIELTGLESTEANLVILTEILNGTKIGPNGACYCGSGTKIKKCKDHNAKYQDIRRISHSTLISARESLRNRINPKARSATAT